MNDERPDRGGELRSPPLDDQVPCEEGGADLPGAGERSSDAPADQLDLDNLLARLQDAERQREQVLDDLRRVAADFDNYRKRAARDQQAFAARAAERLVAKLLPVLDDLERALDAAEHHEQAKVIEGVEMTRSALANALTSEGVEEIVAEGIFDPHVHEALLAQPAEGVEPGSIIQVVQRGYRLGDAVLRPARVIVAE